MKKCSRYIPGSIAEKLPEEYLNNFYFAINRYALERNEHESSEKIIVKTLEMLGQFYCADCVYVFEVDLEISISMINFFWTSKNAESNPHLQTLVPDATLRLKAMFENDGPIIVDDIEHIKHCSPDDYRYLVRRNVLSVLAVPYSYASSKGFIIIENPKKCVWDSCFLLLLKQNIVQQLSEIKIRTAFPMAKRVSMIPLKYIYICMFGRFQIISDEGTLTDDDFPTDQGCNLLAFIIMNRKTGYSPRALCEALWPEMNCEDPYNAIKSAVYRLRTVLALIGLRDLVISSHGTFVLNPSYVVDVDIERFDETCSKIANVSKTENPSYHYRALMGLYKGNILSNHDSYHWLLPWTSYYQNRYLRQMKDYIGILNEQKAFLDIQHVSAKALSIDMYDGDFHYYMIKAILQQGGHRVAKVHFQRAEEYMSEEQKRDILKCL